MAQITIYLDSETEDWLKVMVEKSGKSKSRWIAELIREKTATVWPEKIRMLSGTWSDMPMADEIRSSIGADAPREIF